MEIERIPKDTHSFEIERESKGFLSTEIKRNSRGSPLGNEKTPEDTPLEIERRSKGHPLEIEKGNPEETHPFAIEIAKGFHSFES